MSLLFSNFPFSVILPQASPASTQAWIALATLVGNASAGILSLCLVVLISNFLSVDAQELHAVDVSPPVVATVALVNFFVFYRLSMPTDSLWQLGASSVLTAIFVAIFSAELFLLCSRFKYFVVGQKTYDLDPTLHLAVRAIGPAIATVTLFLLASKILLSLSIDMSSWVAGSLISLDRVLDSQLPSLLVLGVLNQVLWFFGIHGAYILENVYPLLFAAAGDARTVFDISHSFFNIYVYIGGSGSTLGLLLAIAFCVRPGETKRVANYALLPSLFNINELIIFGLPIIFNPVYLVPFVIAPLVQIVVGYFCVRHGWLVIDVTPVPWTTPALLGGTINSGSWFGGALQLFNIVVSALIYAPFVRFSERQRIVENRNNVQRIVAAIESIKAQHHNALDRHDDIGHVARKLLHEFMQDVGTSRVYLAYQPQHDRRGKVVGVEALLRWEHRNFGLISPAVICALAEESHRIIPLGHWVIGSACRQLKDWKQEGIESLRISVNLSPLQLKDLTLRAVVVEHLKANQLQPSELGVELTESQYVPDDSVSIDTLNGLQAMGIHLEMDDFGMGYSSMLYIRRFHFNAIKLDGSLTREVLLDKNCRDIITSVVQLGRALGIRIIAEYVETQEQKIVLEELGCDAFQGHLYSPALTGARCLLYLQAVEKICDPDTVPSLACELS